MDEKGKGEVDPSAWGGCPRCHRLTGIVHVRSQLGKGHWGCCVPHRLRWFLGVGLREFEGEDVLSGQDLTDFLDFMTAPPWFKRDWE
jgi:hypothetical protein